ncbi:DNA mismatch repair protein MutL [Acetobacteraceae bacterium EV16G]|uniref:DNA mismatch repair protein MutL n=1 Tax=Sorlinia euscelidii TaxID=3081148 RepID=A0ABU7TZE6_9PROT
MTPPPAPNRPQICRLSNHVIDLIAAGEVIERPAAALKELVENAVDSGATEVQVALNGGGVDRIDVQDNGCGMTPDDLLLAVERHCTSKLSDGNLSHIRTLGFRGEALPSIGASARLMIVSRVPDADTAWAIRVEGGQITPPAPAAGTFGTRAVVEDLFFATPARRKFLKSARVESGHAEAVMRRIALSTPHCAIKFSLDNRVIIDLPTQSAEARAKAILGESEGLCVLDEQRDAMHLSGFICGPAATRATASGQFMSVNGRAVNDPLLKTAIRVAYRPLIEAGRFPILALSLDLPSEDVDVNVHPAKTELRFAREAEVRSFVIGALQRALGLGAGQSGHHAQLRGARPTIRYPQDGPSRLDDPSRNGGASHRPDPMPYQRRLGMAHHEGPARALRHASPQGDVGTVMTPLTVADIEAQLASGSIQSSGMSDGNEGFRPSARVLPHPKDAAPEDDAAPHPLGAPVAQVLDTYIIAVADDGDLVLVDQHAAHERLTHEHLLRQWSEGQIRTQRLLLPEIISLSAPQLDAILAYSESLARLGLEIDRFGVDSLVLRTIPVLLQGSDAAGLIRDLSEELTDDALVTPGEAAAIERRIDAVIARMACHGSVRSGRRLQAEEMSALLRQMEATPRANTCSHGRPTWLKLSKNEIERLFGRR